MSEYYGKSLIEMTLEDLKALDYLEIQRFKGCTLIAYSDCMKPASGLSAIMGKTLESPIRMMVVDDLATINLAELDCLEFGRVEGFTFIESPHKAADVVERLPPTHIGKKPVPPAPSKRRKRMMATWGGRR